MRKNDKINLQITIVCAVIIVICVAVLILQFEHARLTPFMREICETTGKQNTISLITKTVDNVMLKEQDTNNNLVKISTDSNNNVKSLEINTILVNALENEILRQTNEAFTDTTQTTFKIPVGTLTGYYTLAGKGFNIKLRLQPLRNVKTEIKSEFYAAGINQTKHCLTLVLKADIIMLMWGFQEKHQVELNYLLSETIIVGDVPDYLKGEPLGT
jgi:sporulation protein YunB